MKPLKLILVLAAVVLLSFRATTPGLTIEERKAAMDKMNLTKEALMKSVAGLSKNQLNFKATPDSWSVAECVEHLAITEPSLLGMVQGTLKEAGDPARKADIKWPNEDAIFNAIADRTNKVKTQEVYVPSGKFGSFEATLKEFNAKRGETLKYIETTSDDLRNHYFTFQNALGTMDSYQLLFFISGHTKRHTMQIEEVKSNPAFPKK